MNWNMEGRGRDQFWIFQNFPGGSEKNHKNICNGSQSTGQDLNRGPSEHEARSPTFCDNVALVFKKQQWSTSAQNNNNVALVFIKTTMEY